MGTIITILCLGLIGAVMCCIYLNNELANERSRRFEAELWIDPIALDETEIYEDGGFTVLKKEEEP